MSSVIVNITEHPLVCPQVPDKAQLPAKPSVLPLPNSGHRPASPSSSSGRTPSPEMRQPPLTPPTLEELKNQLRDLRASVELLKSQHRCVSNTEGGDGLRGSRGAKVRVSAAFQAGGQAAVLRAG